MDTALLRCLFISSTARELLHIHRLRSAMPASSRQTPADAGPHGPMGRGQLHRLPHQCPYQPHIYILHTTTYPPGLYWRTGSPTPLPPQNLMTCWMRPSYSSTSHHFPVRVAPSHRPPAWAVGCGGHLFDPVPRSRCIDALVRSSWLIKFLCRGHRLSHLIRQGRSCKAHPLTTVMHPSATRPLSYAAQLPAYPAAALLLSTGHGPRCINQGPSGNLAAGSCHLVSLGPSLIRQSRCPAEIVNNGSDSH